jgi:hypothetical protein
LRGLQRAGIEALATTTRHYVKDLPENTLSGMNLLESLFNECSTPVQ